MTYEIIATIQEQRPQRTAKQIVLIETCPDHKTAVKRLGYWRRLLRDGNVAPEVQAYRLRPARLI